MKPDFIYASTSICRNLSRMQLTRADGSKIRRLREESDLTVDELVAALAEREGIQRHPDHIRNAELGHRQPGFKLLNAIARVLGVPREALLADEPAEPAETPDRVQRVRDGQRGDPGQVPEPDVQGAPVGPA